MASRERQVEEFRRDWVASIEAAMGKNPPQHAEWTSLPSIVQILGAFEGPNRNHVLTPKGGGMDMDYVSASASEAGCLEIQVSPRMFWLIKPTKLEFEFIQNDAHQSFFFLHADKLTPSGVYDHNPLSLGWEELLEIAPGQYEDRSVWEQQFLGYEENGTEIPIPDDARLISRWSEGKFMILSKGSIWNGQPATYDGRHNRTSSEELREAIQTLMRRFSEGTS